MVLTGELSVKGYELLERIGEGAYGAVYRAYQPHMRREVAVKVIQPRFANQPNFIRRFDLEAHLVAQLEHLHIVPLYDYWREPEGAYLVMRLMKGGSLERSLKMDGPWEGERAVRLVEQIASALDAAHRQGVVHRDLKPANILLDEQGNAYLSDFGIAKELGRGKTMTQTGAIVGTPAYISPEQVQSQRVTPQTDIYCLGVVVYELLVAGHPFLDTPAAELVVKHLQEPLPLVHDRRPEISEEVDQIIQRATAKEPQARYGDALELARDFRRALQLDEAEPEIPESEIYNPYKGLRAFQEGDAHDFYGREVLVRQLLGRIEEVGENSRFLAVVGPSGSGKSSVVKAGLLPALRGGRIPGSEEWFITEMKPGAHPLEELELAILRVAVTQPPSLLGQIREDKRGLLRAVRRVLPEGSQLLLVIDQFEELFTLVGDGEQAAFMMSSLYEAVGDANSPLRVVVTLRADYYDRPLKHPDFSTLIEQRTQVVKPLSTSELEQAICEPANRLGVAFESGLTSTIVGEVHEEPGALPILQYALTELFERREGRQVTREAFEQIGGVRGALARRAEEIYLGLDQGAQEAARQLFLRLVTLGEGQEDTRRRVPRSEVNALLGEALPGVIGSYGEARLLTFDHDQQTREPTVEVAHEALLQEWVRLREWLDESRADIRMQRVLGNAAEEWKMAERDPGFLLRGSRLDQFEAWGESTDLVMTRLEMDYLEVSLAERRERELDEAERLEHEANLERRSRNFLRALVAVMAVAMIVALVLTGVAFNQQGIARENAATATYAQGEAIREAATAVAAQEEAQAMAAAEARARQEAEIARQAAEFAQRVSTANELVASAKKELDNPSDVSYGLALLLAKQAVMTSLVANEPPTPGAEEVLRQAIAAAPIQQVSFTGHTGAVNFADWSPDGKYVLTAGDDRTIRIWDVINGEQVQVLNGHEAGVNHATWSVDGRQILSTGKDKTIRIWDLESGGEEIILRGHRNIPSISYWSVDRGYVISASKFELILWNLETSESSRLFDSIVAFGTLHALLHNYVAVNPDGNSVAFRHGNQIVIMDITTGEEIRRLSMELKMSNSAEWDSSGEYLLTAHDLGPVIIWDVNASQVENEFNHPEEVAYASWSPAGDYIASATTDGEIYIWEVQSEDLLNKWQSNQFPIHSVKWSPGGDRVVTASADGVTRIWEVGLQGQDELIQHTNPIYSADWNADASRMVSGSGWFAYTWDMEHGVQVNEFSTHSDPVYAVAWHPDKDAVLSGDGSGRVIMWHPETEEIILDIDAHQQAIQSLAWSLDGTRFASTSQDMTAKIWDDRGGELVHTLQGHGGWVTSVDWSLDGEMLATTSRDNSIRIWDVISGEERMVLQGHQSSVSDADWSPDGRHLASAGTDGVVRIWDAQSGETTSILRGHNGAVISVEWDPAGDRLVTASQDRTARIWDAHTGQEISIISGHEDGVLAAHWSPDGSQVITASFDGSAQVWPVGIQGLLNQADSLILRDPPEFTPGERCLYLHECGE